jgi:hypothetical protein
MFIKNKIYRTICHMKYTDLYNRSFAGADPGFQVRGAHLKKLRRTEGGAKIFGVFRVKNHDFTPKNHIFPNFRGAHRHRVRPPCIRPWFALSVKVIRINYTQLCWSTQFTHYKTVARQMTNINIHVRYTFFRITFFPFTKKIKVDCNLSIF